MKLNTLSLMTMLLAPLYMASCTTTNIIDVNPSATASSMVSTSPTTSTSPVTNITAAPVISTPPVAGTDPNPGVVVSAGPTSMPTPTMTPMSTVAPTVMPTASSTNMPIPNSTPNSSPSPGFVSSGQMVFSADLVTNEEVPPVQTKAKGAVALTLGSEQKNAMLTLNFTNLTGIETGAHIHGPATRGMSAPAIIALPQGQLNNHMITLTNEQLTWLKQGKLYVNVHSSFYTDGEIRGQLEMK